MRSEAVQLELTEAAACADMLRAATSEAAARAGAAVYQVGGATCTVLEMLRSVPMVNRAIGLGVDRAATEVDVDRIIETFQGHRVDYLIAVAPHARPAALPG